MTSHDASKCTCVGSICTCSGQEVVKDGHSIRVGMMVRDGFMRDADPTGRNLSIAEKRTIVARAYGEAAAQKLANEGGKSDDFKEGYAKITGEQFTQSQSDTFIEGFYESLLAGMSAEEAEQEAERLLSGGMKKDQAMSSNQAVDQLADGSARFKFKDGSSVVAYPDGQKTYFDLAGHPARSLTLEQLAFSQGTAQVVDEAAAKLVSAQEYEQRISNAWR